VLAAVSFGGLSLYIARYQAERDDAIAATAELAGQGLPQGIKTYVLGVFGQQNPDTLVNLDSIARAGGTQAAFNVDPGADLSHEFAVALTQIADTAGCALELPQPAVGESWDYSRLEVELATGAATQSLPRVQSADSCDQAELGWHFDADPTAGEVPRVIELCPRACEQLRQGATVRLRAC